MWHYNHVSMRHLVKGVEPLTGWTVATELVAVGRLLR
jgi:hypothetical protein